MAQAPATRRLAARVPTARATRVSARPPMPGGRAATVERMVVVAVVAMHPPTFRGRPAIGAHFHPLAHRLLPLERRRMADGHAMRWALPRTLIDHHSGASAKTLLHTVAQGLGQIHRRFAVAVQQHLLGTEYAVAAGSGHARQRQRSQGAAPGQHREDNSSAAMHGSPLQKRKTTTENIRQNPLKPLPSKR